MLTSVAGFLLFYDKIRNINIALYKQKGKKIEALISVAFIYLFILLGYAAKKIFKEKIEQKSLVLISLYFLQPILTFWGLTKTPIDFNLATAPLIYFAIVTVVLVILIFLANNLFIEQKDKSVFIAASLIGNTGNLGIPLGIALFGEQSVAYTSIINIANIFFIYTVGIFFFAKEHFHLKESLAQMFKIPILWFAVLALIVNYMEVPLGKDMQRFLQMGAYATIVIQLMIFGIYLSEVKLKTINFNLSVKVAVAKHIILPGVGLGILLMLGTDPFIAGILFMQLMVPLAVNNVNIAALYNCKPNETTEAVLVTSVLFVGLLYFYIKIIGYFF